MQNGRETIESTFTSQGSNDNKYKLDKNKLLSVLEFSADIIFILDSYGHIKFVNRAFLRFWGASQKKTAGQPAYPGLPHILLPDFILIDKNKYKLLLGDQEWQSKVLMRLRNGSLIKVNLRSIPLPSSNQFPDEHLCIAQRSKRIQNAPPFGKIKKKKKSSGKANNLERRFFALWENWYDGMCLIDSHGNISVCNNSLCRLFELNREEITGKPFYNLLNRQLTDKEDIIRKFRQKYFVKGFKKHFYLKVVLKSQKTIELDVFQSFMESNGDSFLLNVFRDVTKIKEAERMTQRNQKMTEIGKVASFIVHEIKSPLACLKMNIDLLTRKTLKPEQTEIVLTILQKEVNRLTEILSEISEFNRQGQLQITGVNLNELVEIIRALINPVLEKHKITFVNKIDRPLQIMGDEQRLQTVLVHLIENSIEAIKENGIIEISSLNDTYHKRISLLIKDTGCGIVGGEKIFEPFYTTKASGVGLGLSIVKNIAEQHNGSIRLLSGTPGQTVFELSFNCQAGLNGYNSDYR